MLIIAHRANIAGTNGPGENNPINIVSALSLGFDVEVDVWVTPKGIFFGHDEPTYAVDEEFVQDIIESTWFHCKNLEAIQWLCTSYPQAKFFWHQLDDHTLTSNGYVWTYPDKPVMSKSIIVDIAGASVYDKIPYGICTDYPIKLREILLG